MTKNSKTTSGARAGPLATAAHPGETSRTLGANFESASPSTMGEGSERRAVARTAPASGGLSQRRASQDRGLSLHPGDTSNTSSPTKAGIGQAGARGAAQRGRGKQVTPRRIVQIDPAGGGATQPGGGLDPSLIMHVQFGMAGMAIAHGYAVSKSSRRVSLHRGSAPPSRTPERVIPARVMSRQIFALISVICAALLCQPGVVRKVGDFRRPVTRPFEGVRTGEERMEGEIRLRLNAWHSKNKMFLAHRLKYETVGSGGDRA